MKLTKNIFSLDLIRTAAILGVVAIHVYYPIYSRPDFLGGLSWWLAYLINSLSRVAVPFFLLVSGTLLLPKKPVDELKDVKKRVVWRLGIPLLFWTFIYWYWNFIYYGRFPFIDQAIYTFFTGSIFHLYFLVILIGLYLFLPLWRRIEYSRYFIGLSFTLGILIYIIQFFIYKDRPALNFFTLWVPYLGYFLAGPELFKLKNNPVRRFKALAIFAASFMFTAVAGYFNLRLFSQDIFTFWGIGGVEYFTHWLAPNVVLLSLSGYFLLTKLKLNFGRIGQKLVEGVARNAFGIYLVHFLVIEILDRYFNFYLDSGHTRLWLYGFKKMATVFFLSFLITAVVRKIPLVRVVMGEAKSHG